MWKITHSGCHSAKKNMERDRELLDALTPNGAPTLHFYEWECESITYGHFIKPDRFLDLKNAKKWGIELAKRPTGGGIVFHSWDLAFSALLPSSHEKFSKNPLRNYQFINDLVLGAIKRYFTAIGAPELLSADPTPMDASCAHFCMAKPTIYDVMLEGRKVAGAAQRTKRQGFLHQGTISIAPPKRDVLQDLLIPGTKVFDAMRQNTFALLSEKWTASDLEEARRVLRKSLEESFLLNSR